MSCPISELKTKAGKAEVAKYRRMGLVAEDMAFVMENDAELIVVNKAGLLKLMRAAPAGTAEALRRLQGRRFVNLDGSPVTEGPKTFRDVITLDDELELFRDEETP